MSKNSFVYADIDSERACQHTINQVLNHNNKHKRPMREMEVDQKELWMSS